MPITASRSDAQHLAAVGRGDGADDPEAPVAPGRVAADRRLAAAVHRAQKGALRPHGQRRGGSPRTASSRCASGSPARVSIPSAPWPTAGVTTSTANGTVCVARTPSRFRPAQARTIASYSPSRSLRSRVSTLPRTSSYTRSAPQRAQLRAAARRRRADARAGGQVGERGVALGAERVAGVFARGDGGQGHVLG